MCVCMCEYVYMCIGMYEYVYKTCNNECYIYIYPVTTCNRLHL